MFFKKIICLLTDGVELNFSIKKSGSGLVVSVFPKVKDLKDEASKKIIPVVISGTADDLDDGFLEAISSPVKSATGILSNMAEFEKSTESAAKESKEAKSEQEKVKKQAEEHKKKFDQLSKKSEEFEKIGNIRNAISCLKQALEFTPNKQNVQGRINKLFDRLNTGSFFTDGIEPEILENYLDEEPKDTGNSPESEDGDIDEEPYNGEEE